MNVDGARKPTFPVIDNVCCEPGFVSVSKHILRLTMCYVNYVNYVIGLCVKWLNDDVFFRSSIRQVFVRKRRTCPLKRHISACTCSINNYGTSAGFCFCFYVLF